MNEQNLVGESFPRTWAMWRVVSRKGVIEVGLLSLPK